MAHIYFSFDFGTDEEKAQRARHKLEMWKQAFRLDKKLLYKFERESNDAASAEDGAEGHGKPETTLKNSQSAKPAKSKGKAKTKADFGKAAAADSTGKVKLYLRLGFSGHEKMTEERLLKKFPAEEPFSGMSPKAVKQDDAGFAELEAKFAALD